MSWYDRWKGSGDPEENGDVDVDRVIEMIEVARKEERDVRRSGPSASVT